MFIREVEFETLKGKILINIECKGDNEIQFIDSENNIYHMYHEQDCCEEVYIKDICGNLSHLLDSPITMAECIVNEGNTDEDEWGTGTWTFYKLATVKGYVTISWYGESNGYYSETVDFVIEESIKNKRTYDIDLLSKNVEQSNLLQLDKFNYSDNDFDDVSKWINTNITNLSGFFQGSSNLTELDMSKWDANTENKDDSIK